ncbi:uncharacterized protein LOC135952079 [Calliphora vicina]|uniref:uncharacterized protein LOC135952079 n=1 Tax=Calliphora vicina TaxID=7373 RepID=UPI00325BB0DB
MTTKKLLCILLFAVITVQISQAIPVTNDQLKSRDLCLQKTKYQDMEASENDKLLTASNQLLKFTLRSFQQLSLAYAEKAKNISENLLKDSKISSSTSPKILQFKHNLTQFQEKYSLCADIDELFDLVELYSNTTSFYYELEEATLDVDSKLILSLLRKYGSEDLDNEFEKFFNVFVENFDKKFEDLKGNLKEKEGEVGQKLLGWYDQFKTLKDYDDKIAAFEKYFLFFEQE